MARVPGPNDMADLNEPSSAAGDRPVFGTARYWMLVVCVVAQAVTLGLTWPLWQPRESPPHLPLFDLPQLPFGLVLACTLVLSLAYPRSGVRAHVAALIVSFVFDQWRIQPQVIGVAVLMIATVETWGPAVAKSYLIALWFWSGLHKLLSPDWMGHASWGLVQALPVDPDAWHVPFAYAVAAGEVLLATLAVARPRWAAYGCAVLHTGIALFLSPLMHNWNVSVIPWNLCTAAVGFWVLRTAPAFRMQSWPQWAIAAVLLLSPIGYYVGLVDHSLAHVLYSDNMPYALVTTEDGVKPVARWGTFRVPFPHTQRLYRQYFERTAKPGWKMHVADPRPWVSDAHFLKRPDGAVVEIDRGQFGSTGDGEIAGVECDDPRSIFALSQTGVRMLKRSEESMVYAVEIPQDKYKPDLLTWLRGLPNVEQLQLAGCDVTDADLLLLTACSKLEGIGLNDTKVTEAGLRHLTMLPRLDYIEFAGGVVNGAEKR